jgi:hypothetical protein
MSVNRGRLFQVLAAVLVAALSAVAWIAWLGWDDEYQIDPATGIESGPYEAWQIAGCTVSLLILLVTAVLAGVRAAPASAALTLGFTAAWTNDAARAGGPNLFLIGTFMLLGGLSIGSAMVSAVIIGIRDRRASRPS